MAPLNVMIVDDSSVMRKILERSLRQTQLAIASILEAGDGVEALQKLEANSGVSLLFSDVNMPNMDGLELLRQVKEREALKEIPVVIVTTEGAESKVLQALSLGAAGYIRKPFTPLQIHEAMNKIFASGKWYHDQ